MAAELWSSLGSHGSCVPSKPRPGSLEVPWTSGPLSPSKPRPWGVGNILLLWKPEACLLWSSIVNPWGIPADSPSGSPSSKVKYKIQILESAYQSHQKKKKDCWNLIGISLTPWRPEGDSPAPGRLTVRDFQLQQSEQRGVWGRTHSASWNRRESRGRPTPMQIFLKSHQGKGKEDFFEQVCWNNFKIIWKEKRQREREGGRKLDPLLQTIYTDYCKVGCRTKCKSKNCKGSRRRHGRRNLHDPGVGKYVFERPKKGPTMEGRTNDKLNFIKSKISVHQKPLLNR